MDCIVHGIAESDTTEPLHTYTDQYTHISLLFQLRGPRSNAIPTAMSTPDAQTLVSDTILLERSQGCLEKQ